MKPLSPLVKELVHIAREPKKNNTSRECGRGEGERQRGRSRGRDRDSDRNTEREMERDYSGKRKVKTEN